MNNLASLASYGVTFALYVIAVVLPRVLQQLATWKNVTITLGTMFVASIVGGVLVHWLNGQDAGMVFARIFSIAALSHLVIYAAYMEMYLRLQTRQMQIDHAEREARGEDPQ